MQDAGARADRRALLAELAAGSACTAVLFCRPKGRMAAALMTRLKAVLNLGPRG